MKRIMNLISVSLFIFQVLVYTPVITSAQEKNKNESSSQLNKNLEELESKVNNQKHEIDSLQAELKNLKFQKSLIALPAPKDFKKLPKGSTPFEYNGSTYYVVPIEKGELKRK